MDLAIAWDAARFRGDWVVGAGDLAIGSDLESAVLISLFSDARAAPGFVPTDGSSDLRGWWGDFYEPTVLGSQLWQLNRAVKADGNALLNQVAGTCRASLQWLISDGVVASVAVTTSWLTPQAMAIGIVIAEPNGLVTAFNYAWAWQGIGVPTAVSAAPAGADSRLLSDESGNALSDENGNTLIGEGTGVFYVR